MLKILMVETGNVSANSTVAHIRNSIELTRLLNDDDAFECELVDLSFNPVDVEQYDLIIFNYAGMGCNFDNIERVIDDQKSCRVGWITNEFELFANEFVKRRMNFIITNFEEHGIKKAHHYDDLLITNLNTLIFNGINPYNEKKYGACYFGTYRKYREAYFKKYFRDELILSTTKKNFKKFVDLGLSCKITDKFHTGAGNETLNLFTSTLYIEDSKTHDCFNYMANRFYEALQCNTALFFDRSCVNTINKDMYLIDDYFIIDSYDELIEKTNNLDMDKLIEHTYVNEFIATEEKNKTVESIKWFLQSL